MTNLLFQEVEKYAKLVDSIQYNSQKVCILSYLNDFLGEGVRGKIILKLTRQFIELKRQDKTMIALSC